MSGVSSGEIISSGPAGASSNLASCSSDSDGVGGSDSDGRGS